MHSDTRCRRRRAVGEGAVATWELGSGGHGGSALVRARGTKSERKRRGGQRERGRVAQVRHYDKCGTGHAAESRAAWRPRPQHASPTEAKL